MAFSLSYKNIVLIFVLIRTELFYIYKMVDSECSPGNYKSSKISIRSIIQKPELLKVVYYGAT